MTGLKMKFIKHNKLIAWSLILAVFFSLGSSAWSDDVDLDGAVVTSDTENANTKDSGNDEKNEKLTYDLPKRDEAELLKSMELFAETDELELFVLDKYEYTGKENSYDDFYVYDEKGELLVYEDGKFEDNQISVYDEKGNKVLNDDGSHMIDSAGAFKREVVSNDDGSYEVIHLTYTGIASKDTPKVKEEGVFAVRNKANGFIWWSNPVNATHDTKAREAQVNNLSSPLSFTSGNPVSYFSRKPHYTNFVKQISSPNNFSLINACESIEKIDNGVRLNYNFPEVYTKISMDVILDGDSILVKIPQDAIKEERITPIASEPDKASTVLTVSLLSSFGAAPEGEDGYIVVADGSGAVIEFDNGKTNAAQYSGKVYGRDYAVSQKFLPSVNQQVYLPVYGMIRDKGENALVAIAEEGDENATIRAAVSGQGENSTSYNLAWFDFRTRTVDSFYIGTDYQELTIYESGGIKTGDLAVRYYPLAAEKGESLSYADVANTYGDYLVSHKGVTKKEGTEKLPFFMTLNGGTIKTHSVMGFSVDMQTPATTYSQGGEIFNSLKNAGIKADDMVIAFNDVNKSSIKRQITTEMKYSSNLGGKSDYQSLSNLVSQNGSVLYPSVGFMEYYKSGNGYSFMRHSSKEATRSRANQQKYELAFGTPDKLQKASTILSPFYFSEVFDKIIASLKEEGINTISLDQATSVLYSDFSRKNANGETGFNRKDTVKILTEGFEKLNAAGISILAQSANAYTLPYVSHISNIPLASSNYDIFDYDVPFYQIAVGGLIPCSTKPLNADADLKALTLSALSTATPIHYEFIYEDPRGFSDSTYDKKFYANYQGWQNQAVSTYKMFNDLVGDVAGQKIVKHERVGINEFEVEFEEGRKINVNLDTYEIKIDGKIIDVSEYGVFSLTGGGTE